LKDFAPAYAMITKFDWLLSGSGVMKSPWPGSEPSARGKIFACWF
jgi:hypothetical protein